MSRLFVFAAAVCLCLLPCSAKAAGPFKVDAFIPQGEVRNLTQVSVRFSEPMRPLGTTTEYSSTAPLKLDTPGARLPAGNFRWQDPHTLAYIFDRPVDFPLTIKATVPATAQALSGAGLETAQEFFVNTPALNITVHDEVRLPPKEAGITLMANYALDLPALRERTTVRLNGELLPLEIHDHPRQKGFFGRQAWWGYEIRINAELPPDAEVILAVAPGVCADLGGEPGNEVKRAIRTFSRLGLQTWYPGKSGKGESVPPEMQVSLNFNNPVLFKDLMQHLSVRPEASVFPWMKDGEDDGRAGTHHALPYAWAPCTRYTLTLKPGLRDTYGTVLEKEQSVTFTTSDFFPLFHMPTGPAVLEGTLGGCLPLALRNVDKARVTLQSIPLENGGFLPLLDGTERKSWEFKKLPGAKEKTQSLAFSKERNKDIFQTLELPRLLGFAPGTPPRALIKVAAEATLAEPGNAKTPRRVENRVAHVQITNLGVFAGLGRHSGLAWVTALDTGLAPAGADRAALRLFSEKGQVLWSGEADDKGLAVLSGTDALPEKAAWLETRLGDDIAVLDLLRNMHLSPVPHQYPPKKEADRQWRIHMVSQLPLYQPGQEVRYALFAAAHVQAGDESAPGWKPVTDREVTVEIRDPRGKIVHTLKAVADRYGSIAGEFILDAEAAEGRYFAEARCQAMTRSSHTEVFQVASFRPPDFKIDLQAPASRPVDAATGKGAPPPLKAELNAAFFSGASLAGAATSMEVTRTETTVTPAPLEGYTTGLDQGGWLPRPWGLPPYHAPESVATLSGVLDKDGKVEFALPAVEVKPGLPVIVALEATVTDASGLTSQGASSFILHPSSVYVGIKSPWFAPLGKDITVELKAATWDDKPLGGVTTRLSAERLLGEGKTETAWAREVNINAESCEKVTVAFQKPGSYHLTASITDGQGRENLSRVFFFVPGPGLSWLRGTPDAALTLVPDKKDPYLPGETARIMLENPLGKAQALITLERGGVISHEVRAVDEGVISLDLPLEARYAPYVYAAVTLVKGRTAPPPEPGEEFAASVDGDRDAGAPRVAHGAVLLTVKDTRETALQVAVATDKAEYRPGGQARAEVRVADSGGAPIKARVVLLAVDDRVLRAAGERAAYDPSATFEPLFPLGVTSYDLRTRLANLNLVSARQFYGMGVLSAEAKQQMRTAAPASPPEQDMLAGAAGGAVELRVNFSPMALWLAAGETDEQGRLTASFTLPDTLTSYRLVAVAADDKARFAKAEDGFVANKPLQLLSALPRFGVRGDTLEARIQVQNLSKEAGTVTLQAQSQGMELSSQNATLALNAGESGVAAFSALLGEPGEARLRVRGAMGGETDGLEIILPVLPAAPLTTVAAAGMLSEGEAYSLPVAVPSGLDSRSRLQVILAPSPAAGLPLTAGNLLEYPWDCLEQRFSRAWVRVLRLAHGELLELPPDKDDKRIIKETLKAAERFQQPDGGFSPWPGMGGSHYYLTTYVLLVNNAAAVSGLSLSPETEQRARRYVQNTLEERFKAKAGEKQKTYEGLESDALAVWALLWGERKELASSGPLDRVYEAVLAQKSPNPVTVAAVMLAAQAVPKRNAMTARLMPLLEKRAQVTPTELHFAREYGGGYWMTMGSSLRDNAIVLAALALRKPEYKGLPALAGWVSRGAGEKTVLSTQEAVFSVWGLATYLQSLGGDQPVAVSADWNGRATVTKRFSKLIDPAETWTISAAGLAAQAGDGSGAGQQDGRLTLKAGQGKPYWTARFSFASSAQPLAPENAGFTLSRRWKVEGPWSMGQTVEVEVTLLVPATRRHVLLFDPFPAGLEPLRATRVDLAAAAKQHQYPWEWEETRADGMLLYASVVHPGVYVYTYTLRAAAPGRFGQRPGLVEKMYTPEVFGRTGPEVVIVKP